MSDFNALNKKHESIHYQHDVVFYVPCYQQNPQNDLDGSPTFECRYLDGDSDINMVLALKPDYVLILKGKFDAKTQPFDLSVVDHNNKQWVDDNF